jgi:hypothetical protein
MKVIGLGSPDELRVRFDACELDVLVDVLRDLRAKATRDAVDTCATSVLGDTRPAPTVATTGSAASTRYSFSSTSNRRAAAQARSCSTRHR